MYKQRWYYTVITFLTLISCKTPEYPLKLLKSDASTINTG